MTSPYDVLDGLRQPDQRSCGPTSLVAARMLLDASYRPADPNAEILALHRRLTRGQWPRALGTPPWAVSRQLRAWTGRGWSVQLARLGAAVTSVPDGTTGPVPTYVGDRWLPRHVVLDLGHGTFFDPARGAVGPFRSSWTTLWFRVLPAA
jgi:hypothetical protein